MHGGLEGRREGEKEEKEPAGEGMRRRKNEGRRVGGGKGEGSEGEWELVDGAGRHQTEQSSISSDLLLLISLWPGPSDFQSRLSPASPRGTVMTSLGFQTKVMGLVKI